MTSGLPKVTDRHQRHSKPGPGPLPNPPCKKQRPFSRRTNQASESSRHPPSHHEERPSRTWPVSIRDCCLESFKSVSCSGPSSATLVCAQTSPPPLQCPVTSSTASEYQLLWICRQCSGTPRSGSSAGDPDTAPFSSGPLRGSLGAPHIKRDKIKIAATFIAQNTTLFGFPKGRRLLLKRTKSKVKEGGVRKLGSRGSGPLRWAAEQQSSIS